MSGPKCRQVTYAPTPAEVRASNEVLLSKIRQESAAVRSRLAALAQEWRTRAPRSAVAFEAIDVGDVVVPSHGTLADEVRTARSRVAEASREIGAVLARCAAEEAVRKAREAADGAELARARTTGAPASLSFLEVTVAHDEPVPSRAADTSPAPEASVPDLERRTDRINEILARATAGVDPAVARRRVAAAAAACTRVEWDAALQAARSAVDAADAAEARRQDEVRVERSVASGLHESLVGLDGDDVEHWRLHLAAVLDGSDRLDDGAVAAVAVARDRSVSARLVAVLEDAGCEHLADHAGGLIGYFDHGGGAATRVRFDESGLLLTPVANSERGDDEVRRIEEMNCALDRRLRDSAALVGIRLEHERAAGFGEVPLRVEELPFTEAPAEAPQKAADGRRRRGRRPGSTSGRSR